MKKYSAEQNAIEKTSFLDRITRLVIVPLLCGVAALAYFKGIPYPPVPVLIILVTYYVIAQISICLIKREFHPLRVYFFKLMSDIGLVTIVVYFTGGIESPLFVLLAIPLTMAAILFPLKRLILIFMFGGVGYLTEIWLEHFRIIPHVHVFAVFRVNAFQDTGYLSVFTLVVATVLIGTAFSAGYLIRLLTAQVEKLGKAKADTDNLVQALEEAKAVLEDKVEERTRQISESEEKYRNIVENAFDGIFILQDNVFKFVNKKFEEITGYTAEELKSKLFVHLIAPEDRKVVSERALKRLRGEKVPENYEFVGLRKDGKKINVEIFAANIKYEGRIATQASIRNITERKKVESELRETKEFLENILESSIDGITSLDEHGNLTYVSRGTEDMLGYKKVEMIGTHVSRYYLGGMREAHKIMNGVREKEQLYNYETALVTKDGRPLPIIVSVSQLRDVNGDQIGTLGIYKDITQRKNLEEEIKRTNEELVNFVNTISHDLKSPLVSLRGFASLLLADYKDNIDKNGQRYLERIQKNANYMEALIRDLLELSRVGRVVGAFEKVDASKMIEEVTGRLQHQLQEKKIGLILRNQFPTVYCDRNRILQVFENLMSNSIKFMGDGEDPRIEIGHTDKGNTYEFYVKDNGIGIPKKYHEKIFNIFQRLQDTESTEGTGVGLAIVKRIVENHGGNTWVESRKGKGATFYFTLPKRNVDSTKTVPNTRYEKEPQYGFRGDLSHG